MLSLTIPIQLLLIVSGLLLIVMTWGYLAPSNDRLSLERFDTLLLALLVVAAFAMGVFLTIVLVL